MIAVSKKIEYLREGFYLALFSLKSDYNGSAMGSVWAVFKPLITTVVLSVVMSRLADISIYHFFSFVSINFTTWNFILAALTTSTLVFNHKRNIMINKYIDPEKIILGHVLKYFYIYIISLLIQIFIGVVFFSMTLSWQLLSSIFYVIAIFIIMFFGSFVIACLSPYFSDLIYIIEVGTPLMMWLTPIVYPIEKVSGLLATWQFFNPIYILISPLTSLFYKQTMPSVVQNLSVVILLLISFAMYFMVKKIFYKGLIYRLSS